MGYQLAAANLGAAVVPWVLGIVAENRGVATLAPGLFAAAVALAVVHMASQRMFSRGKTESSTNDPRGLDQV